MTDQNCCYSAMSLTTEGQFGLERENLRITPEGTLALTPHPRALGDKRTNAEITTDFSESQIEIVTPIASSIPEALSHLDCLTKKVYQGIDQELLWPLSCVPKNLPPVDQIPMADFGPDGQDKNDYRIYLSKKYGRCKQLLCGLHFNFSFSKKDLDKFCPNTESLNQFYLHLTAQVMRYRFFLIHLLSASPQEADGIYWRSIRLGAHGYKNTEPIYLDYTDADAYMKSLSAYVHSGVLEGPRELYQHVRIKGKGFEDLSQDPEASRVELRIPDLNPLYPNGISEDDLYLMHLYLMWAAGKADRPFDRSQQIEADQLANEAAKMTVSDRLGSRMNAVFDQLQAFIQERVLPESYARALQMAKIRWQHPEARYAEQIASVLKAEGTDPGLRLARQMKNAYLSMAEHPCN